MISELFYNTWLSACMPEVKALIVHMPPEIEGEAISALEDALDKKIFAVGSANSGTGIMALMLVQTSVH